MNLLLRRLNEPQRRWYVSSLSLALDAPTDEELAVITGMDEKTIRRGRRELKADLQTVPSNCLRQEGGGRPAAEKNRTLEDDLLEVVQQHTAGDLMNARKWLNCRLADLQARLEPSVTPHAVTRVSRASVRSCHVRIRR